MTSKLATTFVVIVLVGTLASVSRAADTGPAVPPPPAAPSAQGTAPMGNDSMMGGGGKTGPQDHGKTAGDQAGGGMMPMSDMMAMMKDRESEGPDFERMSMMVQMNMMLEMNMMMQMNMMQMMHAMMGEMRHGGEGHDAMMDGAGKVPMAPAKPQGAMPPG